MQRSSSLMILRASVLDQAKRWVPKTDWGDTWVLIYATAGMRLLRNAQQEHIWSEIRALLSDHTDYDCPFSFKRETSQARTITGATEGVYGWLSVNYATGCLILI